MFLLLKNFLYLAALLGLGGAFARWSFNRQGRADAPDRFIAVPIVAVAFGFLSPNAYIFCLLLASLPFVAARTKIQVAAVMLLMLATVPIISFTLWAGGSVLLKTQTSSAVALACFLAMLTKPGPTSTGWRANDLLFLPLLITITWMISRGYSSATYLREAVQAVLAILLPSYILIRCVRTREDLRTVMTALLLAVIMLSVVGIYEGVRTWPLYQGFVHDLQANDNAMSLTRRVRGGLMRAPGPFAESTKFGYFLVIGLMVALYAPVFREKVRRNWVIAAVAFAIFLTQSRGAWIGAGVGIVALLWHRRKASAAVTMVLAVLALYGVLWLAAGEKGRLAEMIGRAGDSVVTYDYRADLWERSVEQFRQKPWTGSDLQTVYRVMNDLRQGEGIIDFVNTYAWFGVVGGSFGLAVFVLCSLWAVLRTLPRGPAGGARSELPDWNGFVFAALLACLVMLVGTSFYSATEMWFFVLLAIGAVAARVRRGVPKLAPAPAARPGLHRPRRRVLAQ